VEGPGDSERIIISDVTPYRDREAYSLWKIKAESKPTRGDATPTIEKVERRKPGEFFGRLKGLKRRLMDKKT